MRIIALCLLTVCVCLFGWTSFERWLLPDTQVEKSHSDVFPNAIQGISPIKDLKTYKSELEEKSQIVTISTNEQVEVKDIKTEMNLPSDPVPKPEGFQMTSDKGSGECLILRSISSKSLPAINRSIDSSRLLEKVQIQTIFGDDQFAVYVIPSSSFHGAEILAKQIRQKGYPKARAIANGPLANSVQLDIFKERSDALVFMEKAQLQLKIQDLRVSRLVGKATGRVHLIFNNLSAEEAQQINRLAKRQNYKIENCPASF